MTDRWAVDLDYVKAKTWWFVPLAFAALSAVVIGKYLLSPKWLGLDASLYASAAAAWVDGRDPWLTREAGVLYAAPPPSLLPYLPFIWLPGGLVSAIWMVGSAALAFGSIRAMRLPTWWMLFPPIVDGILVGNANVAVLSLLVLGSGRLAPLAVFLKIYAIIPMIGERRWRAIAVTIGLLATSALVLPWGLWFARLGTLTQSLEQTSVTTSVYGQPVLMIVAAIALLSLGLRRAGWLAVPLLWPYTQLHYAAISLPGLTPYLALAWCSAIPELWVAGTVALAIYEWRKRANAPTRDPPLATGL